jgi:hypothetical protein
MVLKFTFAWSDNDPQATEVLAMACRNLKELSIHCIGEYRMVNIVLFDLVAAPKLVDLSIASFNDHSNDEPEEPDDEDEATPEPFPEDHAVHRLVARHPNLKKLSFRNWFFDVSRHAVFFWDHRTDSSFHSREIVSLGRVLLASTHSRGCIVFLITALASASPTFDRSWISAGV